MTSADNQKIFIEMLIIKRLEGVQSREIKGGKSANQINHIKLIVDALFELKTKKIGRNFGKRLLLPQKQKIGRIFCLLFASICM